MGFVDPLLASFGLAKSKRNRFAPGVMYTRALNWESHTGQLIGGKLSSSRLTVTVPSMDC